MQLALFVATLAAVFVATWTLALPAFDTLTPIDENGTPLELDEAEQNSTNSTSKNLYVIKAVVYEIGILTDADENDTSVESQERVDLTFFDAHTNDSHIDLGSIPLPIQTNVSGQVLTGIAPVNIGAFSSPSELLETLPLTGTIVNITHSDTAFYKLTTSNSNGSNSLLVDNNYQQLPQNLASLLGPPVKTSQDDEDDSSSDDDAEADTDTDTDTDADADAESNSVEDKQQRYTN